MSEETEAREKTIDELLKDSFEFKAMSGDGYIAKVGAYGNERLSYAFSDEEDMIRWLCENLFCSYLLVESSK